MGRHIVHPQPSPPELAPVHWTHTVLSGAGGQVEPRQVLVRFRFPSRERPWHAGEIGIGSLLVALIGTAIVLALGPAALTGDRRTIDDYAPAVLACTFLIASWSVGSWYLTKAVRGAGRRRVRGVTVARTTRGFTGAETGLPFVLYYLGVDDGTSDEIHGWEVPREVYEDVTEGALVEAVVSADRRYLYEISTL